MPLTDIAIKAAKPRAQPFKLSDGEGLHLLVTPSGGKLWRLAYRFGGKQKQLSFGSYRYVTLAEAREKRLDAKKLLASGIDPGAVKKAAKAEAAAEAEIAGNTFGLLAEEFIAKITKEGRAAATLAKAVWLLRTIASPLSQRPISEITAQEVLKVLRPVEAKGNHEAARRARSTIGRVFRYAIASGLTERDVTVDLHGALIAPSVQHRAALTDEKALGKLLAAINRWSRGQPTTIAGLKLLAILALRPGEVRGARWAEIDLEKAVWTIPAGRTKMRRQHRTHLPRQALDVLQELRPLTFKGPDSLVFHATTSVLKPISENTMNVAIRRLGFTADEMSSHGFRAAFATLANESRRWHPDAIERQLGHVEMNNVRRAYARGEFWEERIRLLDWWADHLDVLAAAAGKEKRNGEPM